MILINAPRAPLIEFSSSSLESIASFIALTAAPSPLPCPMPINATPIPCITDLTSAKSRLIVPETVIKSEIPCTACSKMSSARRNASIIEIFSSTSLSFEFGIVIIVSTQPRNSAKPSSACFIRFLPSTVNGFVTTATVNAPSSIASAAMTGAAPVPVPPPSPVVTKTISASCKTSIILSVSSIAACRPTCGFAPAPSPRVNSPPS